MKTLILFDLDGTLTESAEGITKSIQYAFHAMGIDRYTLEELKCFVGPPLWEQFRNFAGFDEEQTEYAVQKFRERFSTVGKFENALYSGVVEMLAALKQKDFLCGIASSKPEQFVLEITRHFHIYKAFDVIAGASMDESRTDKAYLIGEAMRRIGYENHPENVVMVGDRSYDIEGARRCGVRKIGVSYGYGSRQELLEAGADRIADSVPDLQKLLEEMIPAGGSV